MDAIRISATKHWYRPATFSRGFSNQIQIGSGSKRSPQAAFGTRISPSGHPPLSEDIPKYSPLASFFWISKSHFAAKVSCHIVRIFCGDL